ncbi:MAG TPA: Isoquinoline 1-oxidoreductase subunit [Kofleriaceae bacterium]|nr:Isoquinoline 1-oxidoreductase subunit [Kofleriaceae bacterium]
MSRAALLLLAACSAPAPAQPTARALPAVPPGQLASPVAFDAIADRAARSRALFGEIAKVLTHPRCVNCHTPDESPRQGDQHVFHDPPVARGAGDRGVPGMQCTGCHQDHNLELARVPGAPGWHLAPVAMVWLDRTPGQICAQIKDPARNGGRTLAQIQDHLARDPLVAWGWSPGADRAPAPGTQAALGLLAQAWIDSGAECPP